MHRRIFFYNFTHLFKNYLPLFVSSLGLSKRLYYETHCLDEKRWSFPLSI